MKAFLAVLLFLPVFVFAQKEIKFVKPVVTSDPTDKPLSLLNYSRDTLHISLDSNDRVYFYLPNPQIRAAMAEVISKQFPLTPVQKEEFATLEKFGSSLKDLPGYLGSGKSGREKLHADTTCKGIPFSDGVAWLKFADKALNQFTQRKIAKSKVPNATKEDFYPVIIVDLGVGAKIRAFRRLESQLDEFRRGYTYGYQRTYNVSRKGIASKVYRTPNSSNHDFNLQGEPEFVIPKEEQVLQIVDEQPQFPGGMEKLYEYFETNRVLPEKVKNGEISGKVFVRFVCHR